MIAVHRLKGSEFVLNADLIEVIESNPDTVITLNNDRKYIVKETAAEVVELVIKYKRRIHDPIPVKQEEKGQ